MSAPPVGGANGSLCSCSRLLQRDLGPFINHPMNLLLANCPFRFVSVAQRSGSCVCVFFFLNLIWFKPALIGARPHNEPAPVAVAELMKLVIVSDRGAGLTDLQRGG